FGYVASRDAIRVRGYRSIDRATLVERSPSPHPHPASAFARRRASADKSAGRGSERAYAPQHTFRIQLCGSLVRPYWMSTSCLRRPIATGPAAPPLMRKSPLVEHTLPIGEITAAVPQAKASFSLPLAASARH